MWTTHLQCLSMPANDTAFHCNTPSDNSVLSSKNAAFLQNLVQCSICCSCGSGNGSGSDSVSCGGRCNDGGSSSGE